MNKNFQMICEKLNEFYVKKEQMKLRGFNDFNFISLLRNFHDENTHSKIIAEFLNPTGSHYQGTIFLEKFFETLNINYTSKNWQVYTEYFVENCIDKGQGRIDIFLENNQNHIIIENKIGAGDQKAQIRKYVECINKDKEYKPENILVIYLTLDGKHPSDWSLDNYQIVENKLLDQNENFIAHIKLVSYKKEILKWIDKCLQEVQNINNLQEAFKQYKKAVETVTKKENNIMNLKDFLLKQENKDILIELITNTNKFISYTKENNICKSIFQKENLEQIIKDKKNSIKFELRKKVILNFIEKLKSSEFIKKNDLIIDINEFKDGKKWSPLKIFKKEWILNENDENEPIISFSTEFQQHYYLKFIYGIRKFSKIYPNLSQENNNISKLKKSNKHMSSSPQWLLYSYINDTKNMEYYLDILNQGVDKIADYYLQTFIDFLEKNINELDVFIKVYKRQTTT